MTIQRLLPAAIAATVLLVSGCGDDDKAGGLAQFTSAEKKAVASTYANLALASYGASVDSAQQLDSAIGEFLAKPSQNRLDAAKTQWLAARDDYILTEAFRFHGGPIDNPETGPEGQINAWPMDEAYVDYVAGDPKAGIVNDRADYPKITAKTLIEANEKGGETNISTGWHAIEFLLWGQDRSKTGPGERSLSDYTSSPAAQRRATYLRLASEQLVADLESVRRHWAEGAEQRALFIEQYDVALLKILRGIGALNSGELAGERMAVAFESRAQEDEHSCFSDNTNADVVNDIKSVRMVYTAKFPGVSGPGIDTLVEKVDAKLAASIRTQLDATLAKAEAFPATFETMIAAPDGSAERKALADVITALEAQGRDLAAAARKLGVKVNFEV